VNSAKTVLFFPRAVRDLDELAPKQRNQVLADITLLQSSQWPVAKIKPLRGVGLWEVKTGDYRSLFIIDETTCVIARVVNRRDLDRVLGKIDPAFVFGWLKRQEKAG